MYSLSGAEIKKFQPDMSWFTRVISVTHGLTSVRRAQTPHNVLLIILAHGLPLTALREIIVDELGQH
jgi:hypothetical protein